MSTDDDRLREWDRRAAAAQAAASQAYLRLVDLAEKHDTGQARRIALFLASTFDGISLRPVRFAHVGCDDR